MNKYLSLYISLLLISFAACNKPAKPTVTTFITSDTVFKLVNDSALTLYADMYTSATDRDAQVNKKYSAIVPPHSFTKILLSELDTSAIYFYDIYTEDRYLSNWGNGVSGWPLLYSGHSFNIYNNMVLTPAAYYFMGGANIPVTWTAIDKQDWMGTTVWASLDANGKYMKLALRRDATGMVTYKQSNGTPVADSIGYVQVYSVYTGLTQMNLFPVSSASLYSLFNSRIVPGNNTSGIKSRDTLMMRDNDNYYWLMVRP